jgi:outer membrane protein assembly factor BamB
MCTGRGQGDVVREIRAVVSVVALWILPIGAGAATLNFQLQRVSTQPSSSEWHQDAHDAQRTGYVPVNPDTPWTYRWTWNGAGPTAGSTSGHFYHQISSYTPWEARPVAGNGLLYVPANQYGIYALTLSSGGVKWNFRPSGTPIFQSAPAYDPATDHLYAAAANGVLYKINCANGAEAGQYNAGNPIRKAVALIPGYAFVVTTTGHLHKVRTSDMTTAWAAPYAAGSPAQTMPAWSAGRRVIVFGTQDLFVHCVNDSDGSRKWRVKPTSRSPGYPYEFEGGWPVVAEQHGLVFVRMNQGIGLIFDPGDWPTTMSAIRAKLESAPQWKNLFALNLDTGQESFTPCVGPQGVEDFGPNPNLRVHSFPVIKVLPDGKEVAYQTFRAQIAGQDPRWDSHLGEMVLDSTTVPGYVAGDLRYIDFTSAFIHITDENCPITVAGDTLFFAHWAGTGIHRITDRSNTRGGSQSNKITTVQLAPILRASTCNDGNFSPNHYQASGGAQYDHGGSGCSGRWFGAPAWYQYYGVLDPPTPRRDAYSEGVLPRYTFVSGRYVITVGNGGDILVLQHSGTVP